jgi:hypothetical protein
VTQEAAFVASFKALTAKQRATLMWHVEHKTPFVSRHVTNGEDMTVKELRDELAGCSSN